LRLGHRNRNGNMRKYRQRDPKNGSEDEKSEQKIRPFPLISTEYSVDWAEHRQQVDHYPDTPLSAQRPMDTPASESIYPSYHSSETPRSRREPQTTRFENPLKRARAKVLFQDLKNYPLALTFQFLCYRMPSTYSTSRVANSTAKQQYFISKSGRYCSFE